jgi:hypothetical protein
LWGSPLTRGAIPHLPRVTWLSFLNFNLFAIQVDEMLRYTSIHCFIVLEGQKSKSSGLFLLLVIHYYNLHYFPKPLKILPKVCLCDVGWKSTQKYFRVAVAAFWLL